MSPGAQVRAYVGLGSNLGDRRAHLEGAVAALSASPGLVVTRVSPWIETRPLGGPPGQPDFLNGALELETSLPPRALLERCLAIEEAFGRRRPAGSRNGPRTLDLDLLLFGDASIDEPGLRIPHPRIEERAFVLEPLSHLIPSRRLPGSGRTVAERLAEIAPTSPTLA